MTVGFHSPLPPVASGVADYSAALLAALRRRGSVSVEGDGCDVDLYHVGNNQLHREIYRRAVSRPGVVVLHDAVLQHLFLGWLDRKAYIAEFVHNYGEWHRELAARLWDSRARSGVAEEYFRYPMLKRIAETSRAVVVHNPAAAGMVRRHCPSARIREIPHLCLPSDADRVEAERLRASWGFPAGGFVFSVLGFLRETKRLPLVLKALDAVRERGASVGLVVAGEFVSSDLERLMAPLLAGGGILREPWSDRRRFDTICAAVDGCVNLRQPAAGETSGIAIRMMGLEKPVILSDGEETANLPREACLRVAHGAGELDELTEYMLLLAQSRGLSREIGCAAAVHVRAAHAPEAVAAAYWELLCECRN